MRTEIFIILASAATCILTFYMSMRTISSLTKQNITMLEILQLLTDSVRSVASIAHFNSVAVRHTLNVLRPYLISIMRNAADREDFNEAETCKRMLNEIDELIKKPL